jgi:N-dimethylarginine dimethylaminohydrolase
LKQSFKDQEDYFLNFVHLGKNQNQKDIIFSSNTNLETSLRQHGFDGDVIYQDFSPITTMYGGAHCSTQVLRSTKI